MRQDSSAVESVKRGAGAEPPHKPSRVAARDRGAQGPAEDAHSASSAVCVPGTDSPPPGPPIASHRTPPWGAASLDVGPLASDTHDDDSERARAAAVRARAAFPLTAALAAAQLPPGAVAAALVAGADPAAWVPGQSAGIVERTRQLASRDNVAHLEDSSRCATLAHCAERSYPSLDTKGISRQVAAAIDESVASLGTAGGGSPIWLAAELETRTAAAREARAAHHEACAARAERPSTRAWHRRRAEGIRRRWLRVATCGRVGAVRASCRSCDADRQVRPLSCGAVHACPRCRAESIAETRARVLESMAALEHGYKRELSSGWGWRLVTLTLPHGGLGADMAAIGRAFARFWRNVKAFVASDYPTAQQPVYVRRLEVTPSGGGHVHLHVLMLTPYLPHEGIRVWWARAHRRSVPTRLASWVRAHAEHTRPATLDRVLVTRAGRHGRPLDVVPWPVVDVRRADANATVELVKYVVKDTDSGGLIYTTFAADVQVALDGRRVTSATRGLWSLLLDPEPSHCHCCGVVGELTHYVTRLDAPRVTRGPPAATLVIPSTYSPAFSAGASRLLPQ